MFSLPFLAAILFFLFQISSPFLSSTKRDYKNIVDFNSISPARKLHPDPKPYLSTNYYQGTNPYLSTNPKPVSKCNHTTQYIVIPQYVPASGSIFASVPSVSLYTNTLLEAIYSTDILREVFNLCQTAAKQYVDFLTISGRHYLKSLCIENADDLVEFAFRGVEPNFDVLTLPIVARFYANSAANFLYTDGFLRIHNAEDLALAYAQSMADCAKASLNSDPTSKFQVLVDGFVKYFDSLGMFTKEKVPFLAYYVGNEWFVAANNYRWV